MIRGVTSTMMDVDDEAQLERLAVGGVQWGAAARGHVPTEWAALTRLDPQWHVQPHLQREKRL